MAKQSFKPGNLLYPVPAVLVSCGRPEEKPNLITVAWTGTVCTNPPMVYISVRPERYSYAILRDTGEFVINLTTETLARATDYCGVRSGRDVDKWKETGLTPAPAAKVRAPLIAESPVNLECRVTEVKELGSHHMFLAEVVAVQVDEAYLSGSGKFELREASPIVYSHGEYYGLGALLGTFGWSVKKAENTVDRNRTVKSKTAGNKAAGDRAAGNRVSGNKAAGNRAVENRASGNKAAGNRTAGDKAVRNKEAGDRAVGNRSAGDKAAGNKASGNRAVGNKTAGNKAVRNKSIKNKSIRDKTADRRKT